MELESGIGVTTGDGLLMLGNEEDVRRNSKSLEEYLKNDRAQLPTDIRPTEEF